MKALIVSPKHKQAKKKKSKFIGLEKKMQVPNLTLREAEVFPSKVIK